MVTAYFNPFGFRSRFRNYERFRESAGCDLTVVEMGNELTDSSVIHVDGDIMFQKERLLNIGIRKVRDRGFKKVAWVDCDMIFTNPNWLAETSRLLEAVDFVQCYEYARFEDREDGLSAVASIEKDELSYNFGGAWASRIEDAVLYDSCIVGGGDFALFNAATNIGTVDEMMSGRFLQHFQAYKNQFGGKKRVAFCAGLAKFLPHGRVVNRQYEDRHKLLIDFDPDTDIIHNGGGWQWIDKSSNLASNVQKYMKSRSDDS